MAKRHYLTPQYASPPPIGQQVPTQEYAAGGLNSQQVYPQPQASASQYNILSPWKNLKIMNPDPSPNSDPRPLYFRTTMGLFPATKDTYMKGRMPFGILVTPGGASDVPLIDLSQSDVPRCATCASYLSPFEKLSRNGKSSNCPFCGQLNSPKRANGAQILKDRPELSAYVYDIHAPADYVGNAKAEPGFGFIFDMTAAAIESGFTTQMIASVKSTLPSLDKSVNVVFITMDQEARVYDFRNDREYVVGDPEDPVLPRGIPQPIGEIQEKVVTFLDNLLLKPAIPGNNCLADAAIAAKAAFGEKGGVVIANCFGPPSAGFFGLKPRGPREDGTKPRESDLLNFPKDGSGDYFMEIAKALTRSGISLHLFSTPPVPDQQMDLLQFASLSALTGGQLHFYPKLDTSTLAEMHTEVFRALTQEYYWNCSIKLRTSRAIAVTAIYTNSVIESNGVTVPVLPATAAIGFDIAMRADVTRLHKEGIVFQLAMMWTNMRRENMIRIFSFRVPISAKLEEVMASVDEGAMGAFLAKAAPAYLFRAGPKRYQQHLTEVVRGIRQSHANLPSMPHIAHALLSSAVAAPKARADERFAAAAAVKGGGVVDTLLALYPRMFDLRTRQMMDLSQRTFTTNVVLVHRADRLSVWAAPNSPTEDLEDLFGVTAVEEIPTELPETGGPLNATAHVLIDDCYSVSGRYLPVEIVAPGSEREQALFSQVFVEDSKLSGKDFSEFLTSAGYV